MRAIVQRVLEARVEVDGQIVGSCGTGFLLLVAAHREDTQVEAKKLAEKIAHLRVFSDADDKMNLALGDVEGSSVLAVSNFTVYGDASKQRRPSFVAAAPYDRGEILFNQFVEALRALDIPVQTGIFGADMKVSLVNDGPVTLIVEVPPAGLN